MSANRKRPAAIRLTYEQVSVKYYSDPPSLGMRRYRYAAAPTLTGPPWEAPSVVSVQVGRDRKWNNSV